MANYKRKKPRRLVKCTLCTDSRFGNSMKGASKQIQLTKLRVKQANVEFKRKAGLLKGKIQISTNLDAALPKSLLSKFE